MPSRPPSLHPRPAPAGTPRNRIVEKARRFFLSHGFRGVTMDDLAAELGMSKKTLYAHFPSKADLIAAVLRAKLAQLESELSVITGPCRDHFHATLPPLLETVLRHAGEIQPAFIRDLQRDVPELFQIVEVERRAIILKHFGRLLAEGRRTGFVRRDLPTELLLEILLGTVQSILNPAKLSTLNLTPQAAASVILNVFLEGILTRPTQR